MSKLIKLLLGLILFLSFGYWCVHIKTAPTIQNDIKDRALNALNVAGYSSLDIAVDGRDVILSGSVDKAEQRGTVEQIIKVEGIRLIENQILIKQSSHQATNYFLNVEKSESNTLNLQGFVPDTLTHHNFISYVMEVFNTSSIDDYLLEQADPPNNWITLSKSGLDALKQVQTGVLNISNGHLRLTGKVTSDEVRKQVISMLIRQVPINIKTTTQLDIEKKKDSSIVENEINITTDETDDISRLITADVCQNKLDEALSDMKITFKSGSSVINSSSHQLLKKIIQIKAECPSQTLRIVGHTDGVGNNSFNLQLSKKRALAVKKYFTKAGINSDNIITDGVGSNQPIANNRTRKGRNKNRRIEMSIEESN